MQTFQVTGSNVAGISINAAGDTITSYIGNQTAKIYAPDDATFEQFETLAEAATRVVAVEADFDLARVYGSTNLTALNVSKEVVRGFEGTQLRLDAEYDVGAGGTVTYQWRRGTEYDGIDIPDATNSYLIFTNPLREMSGTYTCKITGTASDNKVGTVYKEFEVKIFELP